MTSDELPELLPDCYAVRETEKALLVRVADGREVWVPKSLIAPGSDVNATNDEGELAVAAWFARKEGLS